MHDSFFVRRPHRVQDLSQDPLHVFERQLLLPLQPGAQTLLHDGDGGEGFEVRALARFGHGGLTRWFEPELR